MARLSTHVLDTARGAPAAGLRVQLFAVEGETHRQLQEFVTDRDGRAGAMTIEPGIYQLHFAVGVYFAPSEQPPFLGEVIVRFGVAEADGRYHVPLLVSPYGYTTYRGS